MTSRMLKQSTFQGNFISFAFDSLNFIERASGIQNKDEKHPNALSPKPCNVNQSVKHPFLYELTNVNLKISKL